MENLIGRTVFLKDWESRKTVTSDWGIVKEYDGEYYWIAFCGDENDIKPYYRFEFVVPRNRKGKEDEMRKKEEWLQIRIDVDLKAKLLAEAEKLGLTMSQYVRMVLIQKFNRGE